MEREGDQETTTKYYYAGGFLVARRVDGVATWVHQDHLDSLRAISDGAGAGIATKEFAAFGEQEGSTGTDAGTRGYGAHWQDGESGLLYMGARYYDPVLARFVQPDSVVPEPGDPQSWNRYSFVRNNPFNRIDPTGSFDIGAEIGGRLVEFLGGNRTGGEFFGSLSSGLVPGFGELADAGVLFSLDHRVGTGVRLVAAGSLALSVVTLGTSPNVGGVVRQADDVVEAGAAGVRAIAKGASKTGGSATGGRLADNALVCRGGTCTADQFAKGSGVSVDPSGKLSGVSVNSAPGATIDELTRTIPNKQVGVTTVGDVRRAGGEVTPSRTAKNPTHCTLCGITPREAEDLFTPTIRNPNAK